MTRGFYHLGSSMLTQNRMLSAISNNIANVKTVGFKKDRVISTTFKEMVMNRVENQKANPLGEVTMLRTADETFTIHSQGNLESTERALDFAILEEGFFKIRNVTTDEIVYSRNGSFNLDKEGYLVLEGVGRVQNEQGDIQLGTDNITSTKYGEIYDENGDLLAEINTYNFEDYTKLRTVKEGVYKGSVNPETNEETNPTLVENPQFMWKSIETSNVNAGEEMTNAMATQRIMQSVAQTLKMYDATLQSATNQIAKL